MLELHWEGDASDEGEEDLMRERKTRARASRHFGEGGRGDGRDIFCVNSTETAVGGSGGELLQPEEQLNNKLRPRAACGNYLLTTLAAAKRIGSEIRSMTNSGHEERWMVH